MLISGKRNWAAPIRLQNLNLLFVKSGRKVADLKKWNATFVVTSFRDTSVELLSHLLGLTVKEGDLLEFICKRFVNNL